MMKKVFSLGLLSVMIALLAGEVSAQNKRSQSQGRPAAPVVVSTVEAVGGSQRASYSGTLGPSRKALLSSDVAGRVVKLSKREGDFVNRGEVLMILQNPILEQDLAVMQAKLRQTEAQLAMARQQNQRIVSLYGKKLASAQQYEDSNATLGVTRAGLAADKVQVERLQDQLNRMTIRSPISGQVISTKGDIGQWITPTQTLFEIFNFVQLEVMVGVPGRYLNIIRPQGTVKVEVPEARQSITGRVTGVIRHVDPTTGNFHIRVLINNPRNIPLSGLLARVNLPIARSQGSLTVPRDAIVRRGNRTHVVLVENGKAKLVMVKVIGNRGNAVIVEGRGLAPKAKVIVRGNERLFPGTPIRIAGTLPNK